MRAAEGCPPWCQNKDKHADKAGRPLHIRIFHLDARCWVTAVYSEGITGVDHDVYSVHVNHIDQSTAKLAPREAMHLALILQTRTTAAGVRRLASAMHRAGELLLALAGPDSAG